MSCRSRARSTTYIGCRLVRKHVSERDLNPHIRDPRRCSLAHPGKQITTGQGRSTCVRGGLEPRSSRVFPDSALEYADGGEIPCWVISCAHASGRAPARVKRARRLWPWAGAGAIPGVTAARLRSQPGRSRSVTAVGVPSNGRLAALISALGRPPARTDDTGGRGMTGVGTRYPPLGALGVMRVSLAGIAPGLVDLRGAVVTGDLGICMHVRPDAGRIASTPCGSCAPAAPSNYG
jgi:hypothetical protein